MNIEKPSARQIKTHLGIVRELYPFQNISGRKNFEVFEAVKLANEAFKEIPAFIGAYPKGSMTQDYGDDKLRNKGYRLPYKPSDIDVVPVIDQDDPSWFRFTLADGRGVGALGGFSGRSTVDRFVTAAQRSLKRPVQVHSKLIPFKLLFERMDEARSKLERGHRMRKFPLLFGENEFLIEGFADMSRLMKGPRVEEYRERMRKALYTLPPDARLTIIDACANYLIKVDAKSRWKRAERLTGARMPQFTERKSVKEWKQHRRSLWLQHLGFLWLDENDRVALLRKLQAE